MSLKPHIYNHPTPFTLEAGGVLPTFKILFHSSVEPSLVAAEAATGRRVVWICHALTANSDPSEWWSDLVGEGKYFDSQRDIIICANIIGSCYGSTAPLNWGGSPLDFPSFSVRDIVRGHSELRRYLNLDHIDLLIGASVGGYQSLEWAISEPDTIRNLVLIASNERISPWATAFNESQRLAIEADHTFGELLTAEGGRKGLSAARTMALLSYRSHEGYGVRQSEEDEDCYRAQRACSYQRHQGDKLADRFDAYSYYHITKMLDTQNVGRGRGGVAKALSLVTARTLVIAISSDMLFPSCEIRSMASQISGAEYVEIESSFGHDGFLIEHETLQGVLSRFFL